MFLIRTSLGSYLAQSLFTWAFVEFRSRLLIVPGACNAQKAERSEGYPVHAFWEEQYLESYRTSHVNWNTISAILPRGICVLSNSNQHDTRKHDRARSGKVGRGKRWKTATQTCSIESEKDVKVLDQCQKQRACSVLPHLAVTLSTSKHKKMSKTKQ